MSPSQKFETYMKGIVEDFLHTVVIVDDEALPPTSSRKDAERQSEDSKGQPPDPHSSRAPGGLAITKLKEPENEESLGHELPARDVINAFASQGLVCSILDPDEAVDERLRRSASRADLLVMDWWIDGDRGGRAIELIEEVLRNGGNGDPRLRVIAIYTGQPDLESVADALEKMLTGFFEGSEFHRDLLSMTKGPVRITVLAKEGVKIAEPLRANQVGVSDLPNRLAAEFTHHAKGLVAGVALRALSALRRDTHRILDNLGPDLDPGYLGHRVSQVMPADAENHLTDMVASEIRSVLADGAIGAKADIDAIGLWLRRARAGGLKPGSLFTLNTGISDTQLNKMLTLGLGDAGGFEAHRNGVKRSKKELRRIRDDATQLFCDSEEEALASDAVFSSRMMFRTAYSRPKRELRLGTVVHRGTRFLVCVQPVCDSVRLEDGRVIPFPFVPLEPSIAGETDLMVRHPLRNAWVRLKLSLKPQSIEMIGFPPVNGVVPSRRKGGEYLFKSDHGNFRWIGDLKPEFAQRIAHELGYLFSRVGLDEPEQFRLSRQRAGLKT